MRPQRSARPDLAHDGDSLLDVARHGDADRVGEDDLVRVDRGDLCRHAGERVERHLALERAAEGGRDRHGHPDAVA